MLMSLPNLHNEHILLFDATNVLYRTFHANKKDPDEQTLAGLAHHQALLTLYKYYKKYKPTKVVAAFDRSNWRKEYTKQNDVGFVYKGNRRQNMTPAERAKFERFCEHINHFETILDHYTGIVTLYGDKLEADDLIARVVHHYDDTNNITIISSDSDLLQLDSDNVTIMSPATGKALTLEDYNDDPNFYLFVKCIRGDTSDNIPSAYPRVRKTTLQKAFEDPYEFENVMHKEWKNKDGEIQVVKDQFKINQKLIDLKEQPTDIKEHMDQVIHEKFENPGAFSFFHFLRFCGEYQMERISENIHTYKDLLV